MYAFFRIGAQLLYMNCTSDYARYSKYFLILQIFHNITNMHNHIGTHLSFIRIHLFVIICAVYRGTFVYTFVGPCLLPVYEAVAIGGGHQQLRPASIR